MVSGTVAPGHARTATDVFTAITLRSTVGRTDATRPARMDRRATGPQDSGRGPFIGEGHGVDGDRYDTSHDGPRQVTLIAVEEMALRSHGYSSADETTCGQQRFWRPHPASISHPLCCGFIGKQFDESASRRLSQLRLRIAWYVLSLAPGQRSWVRYSHATDGESPSRLSPTSLTALLTAPRDLLVFFASLWTEPAPRPVAPHSEAMRTVHSFS